MPNGHQIIFLDPLENNDQDLLGDLYYQNFRSSLFALGEYRHFKGLGKILTFENASTKILTIF